MAYPLKITGIRSDILFITLIDNPHFAKTTKVQRAAPCQNCESAIPSFKNIMLKDSSCSEKSKLTHKQWLRFLEDFNRIVLPHHIILGFLKHPVSLNLKIHDFGAVLTI